jgi:tRNA dimethylallyltransferase
MVAPIQPSLTPTSPILFIVGPTAVGKTEVAVEVAEKISGEIVTCDAMQVYREVTIAANKPSPAQRAACVHHLLDVISVVDEFDVGAYQQKAIAAIQNIMSRGKIPIICGGSGMYVQVLVDGIFSGAPRDTRLRCDLMERAQREGLAVLYADLQQRDEAAAQKIHPHDLRRVIRALEVCLSTQRPFSQIKQERLGMWGTYPITLYALTRERPVLYDRINRRVDQMIAQGLVEEIRQLDHLPWSPTAQRMIGVREIQRYLRGELDLSQAVDLLKLNTRRLAKRQLTWFRKDTRLIWHCITGDTLSYETARSIVADWQKRIST